MKIFFTLIVFMIFAFSQSNAEISESQKVGIYSKVLHKYAKSRSNLAHKQPSAYKALGLMFVI